MIPQLSDALLMWDYQAPKPRASSLKKKKEKKSKLPVQFDVTLDCTRVIPRLSDADEVWYIPLGSWRWIDNEGRKRRRSGRLLAQP